MTAVMPRRVELQTHSTATPAEPNRSPGSDPMSRYTWVLSVRDWQVHALADPCPDPPGGVVATRCEVWHPIACPVTVARRGELCSRCAAMGVGRLELLPDRLAQ